MAKYLRHEPEALGLTLEVGSRRGKPVILRAMAGEMHRDGHEFFVSENGVWLTDHVPAKYIERTYTLGKRLHDMIKEAADGNSQ